MQHESLKTKMELLTNEVSNLNQNFEKFEKRMDNAIEKMVETLKKEYVSVEKHARLEDEVSRQGKILYGVATTVAIAIFGIIVNYLQRK